MNIELEFEEITVSGKKLTVHNPCFDFTNKDIYRVVIKQLDIESLFEMIVEKDSEILHNYLQQSGYIYNKA